MGIQLRNIGFLLTVSGGFLSRCHVDSSTKQGSIIRWKHGSNFWQKHGSINQLKHSSNFRWLLSSNNSNFDPRCRRNIQFSIHIVVEATTMFDTIDIEYPCYRRLQRYLSMLRRYSTLFIRGLTSKFLKTYVDSGQIWNEENMDQTKTIWKYGIKPKDTKWANAQP